MVTEDLEARVTALEDTLETLIGYLGMNNSDLLDTLMVLAEEEDGERRTCSVNDLRAIICPRNPPGC